MVLKRSVLRVAPKRITINYLHFALISMETEFINNFQIKPYLDSSNVTL